jgi:hypothetical protein
MFKAVGWRTSDDGRIKFKLANSWGVNYGD